MEVVNTYTLAYPMQGPPEARFEWVRVRYVLVLDGVGLYAVYAGMGDPEWIARNGTKQTYKEAKLRYPFLTKGAYRH
jgi:hypothetical protein